MPGHTLHEIAEIFYCKTKFMSYHFQHDWPIYPQQNNPGFVKGTLRHKYRRSKTLGGPWARNSEGAPNQWYHFVCGFLNLRGLLDIVHPVNPLAPPLVILPSKLSNLLIQSSHKIWIRSFTRNETHIVLKQAGTDQISNVSCLILFSFFNIITCKNVL